MNLPEISIRNPVFAWMLMSALIIFGGISFTRMGVSQLPDVDFPVVNISLTLEGAAPEVMETDVVDIVEDAMMTIEGVTSISSNSRQGSANVSLEFTLDRGIDLAIQDVQTKMAQVAQKLPNDLEPAVISKTNPEDQPILWLGVSSTKHTPREIMMYVRDYLKDQFSTVPGVGEIFLGGYVEPALRVWVNEESLKRNELSITDIIQSIQSEHSEPPAGIVEQGQKEFNLRTLGEAKTIEEFENIRINTRGGQPNFIQTRLGQVSKIEEGLADVRRKSRNNGKPAVGLGIKKQRGANAVDVAKRVKAKMLVVQKILPEGMELGVNFDGTSFIEEAVGELNFTIVLAAILTAIVCWMFLGSISSTTNIVLAIPTSIVGTFIFLYFSGFTLNTFTLLALSLAIGIVVDDAIMVLENIMRHQEMGKDKKTAALDGSVEITFAAIAATISIIAIFLPVAFMKGAIGKFFYQFGVTMTVAVLLSLLEALTLTPMRCAQFVDKGSHSSRIGKWMDAVFDRLKNGYSRTLKTSLNHKKWVLGGAFIVTMVSMFLLKFLNKEFSPPQDQGRFLVRLQTPVGSSLEYTDSVVQKAEKILADLPEKERYYVAVGGFGGGEVNSAVLFITLKPKKERKRDQFQIMDYIRKEFNAIPTAKAMVQDLSMRGFTASRGFPVEFNIRGKDWNVLSDSVKKIIEELNKTGMMTDLDSDYLEGMPEVRIIPDRKKAASRGVSVAAIGQVIGAMINGTYAGKYSTGGHRYDIRLKLENNTSGKLGYEEYEKTIRSLYVRNNRGELVSLSEVVSIEQKPTLQSISRKDRERSVTVFANVVKGKSQQDAMKVAEQVSKKILPEGYRVVLTGSSQSFKESFESLIFALILGFIVAYMVLGSQFNSFVDPFTVLLALPFSFTGAFLGLLVMGQSLNIYSMIGLIMLMGIVKKNSILLVDFTNQVLKHKKSEGAAVSGNQSEAAVAALLEACPNRLRPIVMTSLATIVGAMPAAFALGPGAETRIPMAVTVIGGVLFSTFLTLYVVPSGYVLLSKLKRNES